ncbi:hypothetical protein BH11PLA2_BH11PLA2_03150 [soil metagenome]
MLEQGNVYNMFDFSLSPWLVGNPAWIPPNKLGVQQRPPVYVCPSDLSKPFIAIWPPTGTTASDAVENPATGSYAVVHGRRGPDEGIDGDMKVNNTGMFNYKRFHRLAECTDGTSNTIIVGEVIDAHTNLSFNIWTNASRHESTMRSTVNPPNTKPGTGVTTSPYSIPLYGGFGSRHPRGAVFAFADGHVQFINDNIPLATYKALSTRAGGESVNASSY